MFEKNKLFLVLLFIFYSNAINVDLNTLACPKITGAEGIKFVKINEKYIRLKTASRFQPSKVITSWCTYKGLFDINNMIHLVIIRGEKFMKDRMIEKLSKLFWGTINISNSQSSFSVDKDTKYLIKMMENIQTTSLENKHSLYIKWTLNEYSIIQEQLINDEAVNIYRVDNCITCVKKLNNIINGLYF